MQRELATAYERIGEIQGNPYSANLGDADGALASYRKGLAIREKLKNMTDTLDARMEMGRSYRALGDLRLEEKGDVARHDGKLSPSSKAIFEELALANPQEVSVQDESAPCVPKTWGIGLGRSENGTVERLKSYQTALAIRETFSRKNPPIFQNCDGA